MSDLPRRRALTEETTRRSHLRPLLTRIDKFMDEHPGTAISPPYCTTGKKYWEVRLKPDKSDVTVWDDPWLMMKTLEEKYSNGRK